MRVACLTCSVTGANRPRANEVALEADVKRLLPHERGMPVPAARTAGRAPNPTEAPCTRCGRSPATAAGSRSRGAERCSGSGAAVGEVCQECRDDAVGGGGHVDRVGGEQPLDLEAVHDGHDRVGCVFEVHVGPDFAEFACFDKGLGDEDAQSRVALAEVLLGGVAFGDALRRQDGMVRLIGCVPEDVEPTVGEFLRLLNQGRLRDIRLGRGRRTSENAVGDAGRPGEVDGVPPSVRGPVTDEAGRRPKGAPVRPSFARHAGTELPTSPPMRRVRHHADVAPPTVRINGWWGERDAAGCSA